MQIKLLLLLTSLKAFQCYRSTGYRNYHAESHEIPFVKEVHGDRGFVQVVPDQNDS